MSNLITLQDRLDASADRKLEQDVKNAFKALESALSKAQCQHSPTIRVKLWNPDKHEGVEGDTTVHSLCHDLIKFFIREGAEAYRTLETKTFMDQLDDLQQQIDGLPQQ